MDKRNIIAIALLFLMWAFYPTYLKWITPKKPPLPQEAELAQNESKGILQLAEPRLPEEASTVEAPLEAVKPVEMEIETKSLHATFSNIGGGIRRLVSFMKRNGIVEEVVLFDIASGEPSSFVMILPGTALDLERAPHTGPKLNENGRAVEFTYTLPAGLEVVKKFEVGDSDSTVKLDIEVRNPMEQSRPFFFELGSILQKQDPFSQGKPAEMQALGSYAKVGSDVRRASFSKLKKKGEYQEGVLSWIGLGRLYYAVLVKPEGGKTFESFRASADDGFLRGAGRVPVREIVPGETVRFSFLIYAGPTYRSILKSFNAGFEDILASGIWGIFKTIVLVLLGFFYQVFKNYGIAIIAVALTARIAFWPLTHKSFESMQKMQMLQPKMKALQEQHKGNPEKLQKEMMEFYKRNKVNPFGGCLPLLVQMPIFFALYQVLSQAVELRGAHFFGWITDLSEPEALITLPFSIPFFKNAIRLLPVLYILSTVWQQKLQPSVSSGVSSDQEKMMKIMPIFIGLIFYHMPSGLVLYFLISNLLMIQSQWTLKRKFAKSSSEESVS